MQLQRIIKANLYYLILANFKQNASFKHFQMNKNRIYTILWAAILSILIGIVTNVLMGGSLNRSLISYLWSAGYSLSLGLPLFGNGLLFEFFAKRYIDWINRPGKSIMIAFTIHMVYTSLIIFVVNWFWFVYLKNSNWSNFWMQEKATIVSEYIIFIVVASIIYAVNFFKAWRYQLQETEKVKSESSRVNSFALSTFKSIKLPRILRLLNRKCGLIWSCKTLYFKASVSLFTFSVSCN